MFERRLGKRPGDVFSRERAGRRDCAVLGTAKHEGTRPARGWARTRPPWGRGGRVPGLMPRAYRHPELSVTMQ